MSVTKMKDPKDVLKRIQAGISGVSPDKVKFANFRDKKKKKVKKTILQNEEGFEVTDVSVEFCSYDKIGGRRKIVKKNSLEEWGAFDFFYYTEKKYVDKYTHGMGLNVGGNSVEINRIRDRFYDLFGFCCNLIMRDYIDFFFDHYIDQLIEHDGAFYFNQMRNDKIICEFQEGYNFSESFLRYLESEKPKDKDTLSSKVIQEAYMISDTSLVSNYGIVISLNWLIKVKKISPTDASRMVVSACRELASKGMVDVIKSATETYSPYPSSLLFKKPQIVIDKIDKNIKLDIEFNNSCKYEFLQ